MKRPVKLFMLAVAFDVYWFAVVVLRERGQTLWLTLAVVACLLLPTAQRLNALLLAAAGSGLDSLLALAGLIRFTGSALLPLWMIALWLMFAVVWTQLTRSTALAPWILSLLAVFGGPLAYWTGARLGAIVFVQPTLIVVSVMAAGWLVLMLFFHILMGRRQ